MARVRSTARVTHDGEEAETAETASISKVMKRLGLVVEEDVSEDDYSVVPSKPSHLEFGRSTITEDDMLNPAT